MTHHTPLTLAELTERTGLGVLAHLERSLSIPVVDGIQAQGDLIVVPFSELPRVTRSPWARWRDVEPGGVEQPRGANGGNPPHPGRRPGHMRLDPARQGRPGPGHRPDPGQRPRHLIHPEHGATGITPGTWTIRRQRERGDGRTTGGVRMIMD
ncbi:hypothetical protein [Streptomyces sp. PT12]|uniref:hypothetical protein n=1 Tax=Streptomyces sp. PT12 TaxID=1510197 RepID=UPI00215C98E8|nr:hypothetical protein [Streptomyces sp. PT12]